MSAARLLIGDVFERMAELDDGSFDLIITSPPFLALRSYLPDGHPDKAKEIGSEATPAEFLDTMLALTAEWRRLLAPHGSIAIEIGDTYAGSGGAGGDYKPGGWRAGQQGAAGSMKHEREHKVDGWGPFRDEFKGGGPGGNGWPLDKSLCGIPTLYTWSLAYGRNLLTGQPSPAGQWRIRNLKPWIRSNPPVGALGDKERPATSYVTVATLARDRWFDLDAVRTGYQTEAGGTTTIGDRGSHDKGKRGYVVNTGSHPAGAPPLDWWHHVDAIIDAEIDERARKPNAGKRTAKGVESRPNDMPSGKRGGNWDTLPVQHDSAGSVGARGVHIRRRLEAAGILTTLDALDVSPKGYAGAHYAVWPPELVRLLVDEMCPRRVCTVCGEPSRRLVGKVEYVKPDGRSHEFHGDGFETNESLANRRKVTGHDNGNMTAKRPTLGWSDCGHDAWRPGRILDPFGGSGTTGAVATGMGRDCVLIDLDERNAELAQERIGLFLEVDYGPEAGAA